MFSAEIPDFLRKVPTSEGVTNRKWEVLGCIANGMEEKQIAEHLGISFHTVEAHIEQIFTGTTPYSGIHRATVLAPLVIEGVKTGRIIIEQIPDEVVLTKRERQVKDLMLEGQRPLGVANELGLSLKGADFHFRNIYKKLKAKNYYHAVAILTSYRSVKLGQLNQVPNSDSRLAVPVTNSRL